MSIKAKAHSRSLVTHVYSFGTVSDYTPIWPNPTSSASAGQAAAQSSCFAHEPVGPMRRGRNGRVRGGQLINRARKSLVSFLLAFVLLS